MKKLNNHRILLLILLCAFAFRFFRIWEWQFFGMDQEYEAYIIRNILSLAHLPLIGVNASDTGLYLGPFFLYFASLAYALSGGSPLGGSIAASLIGVVTTAAVYFVGMRLRGARTGLFAALLYAVSFSASFYDRQFWNPTPVPLLSLLLGYALVQIQEKKGKWLIGVSLCVGLSLHVHLSLLLFLPLVVWVLWKERKTFQKKEIAISSAIFIICLLPLLVFDLRHGFTNTKALLSLITGSHASSSILPVGQRILLLYHTVGRFFWTPPPVDLFLQSGQCSGMSVLPQKSWSIVTVCALALCGLGLFRLKSRVQVVIGSIFALTLLFVLVYPRGIFEYYFLFLFPWLSIAASIGITGIAERQKRQWILWCAGIILLAANSMTLATASMSYSYKDKMDAISFAQPYIKGHTYRLEAVGGCARYGGYRYLFSQSAGPPVHSYMDSYFAWLYPEEATGQQAQRVVLLSLTDSRQEASLLRQSHEEKLQFLMQYNVLSSKTFGRIQVYILEDTITQ